MKYFKVIYDVSELNQLLSRDIVQILYRLYSSHETPSGLSVIDIMHFWYRDRLDEYLLALMAERPSPFTLDRHLYGALSFELHPAYDSLLCRMVRLPHYLYSHEVVSLELTQNALALNFHKTNSLVKELEHARDFANIGFSERPVSPSPTLHRPAWLEGAEY